MTLSASASKISRFDDDCLVYEHLIRFGPSGERRIVECCEISTGAVRGALKRLIARGVVSLERRAESRQYVAGALSIFIDSFRFNRKQSGALSRGNWRGVKILKNKNEVLRAIERETIRSKTRECLEITDIAAMLKVIRRSELASLRRAGRKRNINVRGIYTESTPGQQPHVESSVIAPEFTGLSSNIGVYGDSLFLTSFKRGMPTVRISEQSLVKTFRTIFEYAFFGLECLSKVKKD